MDPRPYLLKESLLTSFSSPGFVYSAHPYGRVSVLSSYADFFNTDAGAPNLGATLIIFDYQTLL